ncbi:G-type lectin S-receptor-like serine/threonine-protein kinase At4g27290 isoform X1 [Carica papaya]|uniref:G-type lectin S-receptor-like serine/threonine-protein kinase At4g27290 isoform X1 n=1 Tax=Carica papaya TaxID=3649 RepID=UPI000B8CFDFD|nr:G-type lectin S-receptor-like serine/threonine-protein kinase At4g27290 isoform X1 [Carica papaya]
MAAFCLFVIGIIGFFAFLPIFSTAQLHSVSASQSLNHNQTLVSPGRRFELGFFSPGSSKNQYLGIWCNIPDKTVVWVANRVNPINDSPGLLTINSAGDLLLLSHDNRTVIWSLNLTKQVESPPILLLLDSGNLVLGHDRDINSGIYLWQSFDYPTDTLLPGMKLGWDLKTGHNRVVTSWKSPDDPAPGDFSWDLDLTNYPQSIMRKGSEKYYRGGPWNGIGFSGVPALKPNPVFNIIFVSNADEVYYTYELRNKSEFSRIVVNQSNYKGQHYQWREESSGWVMFAEFPRESCDNYRTCGINGNCNPGGIPFCQCFKGFEPKSLESWNQLNWSEGCVRRKPLDCKNGDGFITFSGLKVPDTTNSYLNTALDLKECGELCLRNCSCMAYTSSNISGEGSGCAMWFHDLIDIRQFLSGGQDLYVRVSASEIEGKTWPKVRKSIIISCAVAVAVAILVAAYCIHKIRTKEVEKKGVNLEIDESNQGRTDDMDLPLFDLATIVNATDNFSIDNKLGEGGFGPVYKGRLLDGQEIAVKRLSRSSRQGLVEFKNEVKLIAKLQHRNLVKLLGCCVQGDDTMLVYEYMPNKSLDFFIFDEKGGKLLDWSKRYQIICGIARGLLYLHQDSRLRIIHRDLKASNVLLDEEMRPKISDFGMARTFGGDQTEGNTNRVVGTYGYMAPEYAIDGQFSIKSDVFSFGILLLEIISGQKNRGFYHQHQGFNLIGHAWRLWKEGKPLELIDPLLGESCVVSEVTRFIHISLLCVQQHPEDRPTMSSVVLMLSGESDLPEPNQPGFLLGMSKISYQAKSTSTNIDSSSTNEVTITLLEAR